MVAQQLADENERVKQIVGEGVVLAADDPHHHTSTLDHGTNLPDQVHYVTNDGSGKTFNNYNFNIFFFF